jgi:ribosomal protein S6
LFLGELMENNLDVNILVQVFNERIAQMSSDLIVKDTLIRQLTAKIEELESESNSSSKKTAKKDESFE